MNSPIEKNVPSTNPFFLWTGLVVLCLLFPWMLFFVYKGYMGGGIEQLLLGAYGAVASLLASYFISHQIRKPDRIKIEDSGFEYSFLNLTFRAGWEDVEEISLDDSNVIKIKLHSPEKVAYNSLVKKWPIRRSQFNPYTKIILKRTALLQKNWVSNKNDLAQLLIEAGKAYGHHIAIPVFESAEEAERLYNEMRQRLAKWKPSYEPLSITDRQESEGLLNDETKTEEAPRERLRRME